MSTPIRRRRVGRISDSDAALAEMYAPERQAGRSDALPQLLRELDDSLAQLPKEEAPVKTETAPPPRRRRVERLLAEQAAMKADSAEMETAEEAAENEDDVPPAREVVATNTGVRLACTMAAMIGLFALFLCFVEKESRVIRRFAVQSAGLTAVHAAGGVSALVISRVLGGIPYLGMMVSLICLLGYVAALILLLVARLRLMRDAWQGVRPVTLPALEARLKRFY